MAVCGIDAHPGDVLAERLRGCPDFGGRPTRIGSVRPSPTASNTAPNEGASYGCATATFNVGTDWATDASRPLGDASAYWLDFTQRSVLFWDTLRQRGNN